MFIGKKHALQAKQRASNPLNATKLATHPTKILNGGVLMVTNAITEPERQ